MERILIVEDEENQLSRMKEILEREFPDYDIQTAPNPARAAETIDRLKAFSLIVADYDYSKSSDRSGDTGYTLLEYCKNNLTQVPVIVITAYGKDLEKEVRAALSFQKGAFDFMDKPLDFAELIERIKRAIAISKEIW